MSSSALLNHFTDNGTNLTPLQTRSVNIATGQTYKVNNTNLAATDVGAEPTITTLVVTKGGTGLSSTTINQILYSSAANTIAGLASGNSGILVTSGAGVPSISTDIPTAVTIGTAYIYRVGGTDVAVADGGSGASTLTGILIGNGTSAFTGVTLGASQSIRRNSGDSAYEAFTPGSGTGLTWNNVTGITQAAAVNNGYIANNADLVAITLPSTAAVGDIMRIVGAGAGGWQLLQNASQQINFGATSTTSGIAGYLASSQRYNAVEIICITANTTFVVIGSQGNLIVT